MATRYIKCPLCSYKTKKEDNVERHIENRHKGYLRKHRYTAKELLFRERNSSNPNIGRCVVCGERVKWDEERGKYPRICDKSSCKTKLHKQHVKNTKEKYGVEYRLQKPEYQRKLLLRHRDSKEYIWSDKSHKFVVLGNVEHKLIQRLDKTNAVKPKDLECPASFEITYKTPDGKKHNHYPDFYIKSLNLIISCKDGLKNPNTHPGFKKDRLKNLCEYREILNNTEHNYVQIEGENEVDEINDILKTVKKTVRSGGRYVMPPRIDFMLYKESFDELSYDNFNINANYMLIGLKDDKPIYILLAEDLLDNNNLYHFDGDNLLLIDGEKILENLNMYCVNLESIDMTINIFNVYNNLSMFENKTMIDIVAYEYGIPSEYDLKDKIETIIDYLNIYGNEITYHEYIEKFDKDMESLGNKIEGSDMEWLEKKISQ